MTHYKQATPLRITMMVTAGFVEMDGGLPLIVNGELVGAIGVSSAQPDWDAQIAAAGAAALAAP